MVLAMLLSMMPLSVFAGAEGPDLGKNYGSAESIGDGELDVNGSSEQGTGIEGVGSEDKGSESTAEINDEATDVTSGGAADADTGDAEDADTAEAGDVDTQDADAAENIYTGDALAESTGDVPDASSETADAAEIPAEIIGGGLDADTEDIDTTGIMLQIAEAADTTDEGLAPMATADYTLYFKNGASGWNLYAGDSSKVYTGQSGKWSVSGSTLTMNGFEFETGANMAFIASGNAEDNATIVLNGANSIASTYNGEKMTYGLFGEGYSNFLTITSSTGGRLSITGGTSSDNRSDGLQSGTLTINGNAKVTATGGAGKTGSTGISGEDITVEDNATVIAAAGTSSGGHSFAIASRANGLITIGDNATVTATGGTAASGGSYGIRLSSAGNPFAITGGTVVATGNTRAIEKNYTVPAGSEYYVNTTTAPSNAPLWGNGSTTIIGSSHKYAKITVTETDYTIVMSGGKLYKDSAAPANDITDQMKSVGATVSGDTLYLDGFHFETTAPRVLDVQSTATIVVNGTSSLTSTYSGSAFSTGLIGPNAGSLTIRSSNSSSLSVTAGNSTTGSRGIVGTGGGNLIITGRVRLTATGGSTGMESYGIIASNITVNENASVTAVGGTTTGGSDSTSYGIASGVSGYITVSKNATVTATGGAAEQSYGINLSITVIAPLVIDGGSVTATGNTRAIGTNYTVPDGHTYYVNTATTPTDMPLTGDGSATIIGSSHKYAKIVTTVGYTIFMSPSTGSLLIDNLYGAEITATMAAMGATVSPDGKTLTLEDFYFNTTAATALSVPSGTTIVLKGDNGIASLYNGSALSRGIYANGTHLIITSSTYGRLTVAAGSSSADYSAGIVQTGDDIIITGSAIVIASGGDSASGINTGISGSYVTIADDAEVVATGGASSSDQSYGIVSGTAITIDGGTVTASGSTRAMSVNYVVPSGYGYYVNTETTPDATLLRGDGVATVIGASHKYAKIKIPADYSLYLDDANGTLKKGSSGTDITEAMAAQGAAVTGEPGSRILTLTDFSFETTDPIALSVPDGATIVLKGDNTITSIHDGSASSYRTGILGISSLNITSSSGGVLTTSGYGVGIRSVDALTINGNATVTATGRETTSDSNGIIGFTSITIGDNAKVTATGATSDDNSYGIRCDTATIEGNAEVIATGGEATNNSVGFESSIVVTIGGSAKMTATGGTAGGNSYGIAGPSITIDGNAEITTTGGEATNNSFGVISPVLSINGGTLTATGNTRAIRADYTVPDEYTYYVNTTTTPSTAKLTGDGSTTIIGASHKYAKITPAIPVITTNTVTVHSAGTGASGSGIFEAGDIVLIYAGTAPAGKQFNGWTATGVTLPNPGNPNTSFTMPSNDVEVTATYSDLVADPGPGPGPGTGTGGGGGGGGGGPAGPAAPAAPAVPSELDKSTETFDKSSGKTSNKDISVTLKPGSGTLMQIKNGNTVLKEGVDYTKDGNTYTLTKEYLETLKNGKHIIVFDMNTGTDPVIEIVVRGTISTGTKTTTTTQAPNDEPNPFNDIPAGAWYLQDVLTAYRLGLINGKTANTFEPEANITFAEVIKLAACMHQLYHDGEVTLEVGAVDWYSTYMDYAVENGIIAADLSGDAGFMATRADFVNIFYSAIAESEYTVINEVADNAIPDVKLGDRYAERIYAFYRAGILVGSDAQGTFNPESNIARSEVAAIMTRLFNAEARRSIELT